MHMYKTTLPIHAMILSPASGAEDPHADDPLGPIGRHILQCVGKGDCRECETCNNHARALAFSSRPVHVTLGQDLSFTAARAMLEETHQDS